MDEQALLNWKSANKEVYSKFKMDLERQFAQPYHQTILDLGDDNAEPLKSVLANLISNTSKDGIDADAQVITLNYRRAPEGYFCGSMFTSCSPRKEKALAKSS